MSHLRPSRGGENRRSVFYTANNEEWEMVDPPTKDTPEHKSSAENQRRESPSHLHRRERLPFSLTVASRKLVQYAYIESISSFLFSPPLSYALIVVMLACFSIF